MMRQQASREEGKSVRRTSIIVVFVALAALTPVAGNRTAGYSARGR